MIKIQKHCTAYCAGKYYSGRPFPYTKLPTRTYDKLFQAQELIMIIIFYFAFFLKK
jgi:hypothetical protein